MSRAIAIDLDDTLALTSEGIFWHVGQQLQRTMQPGNITSSAYWAEYGIDDSRAIKLVHGYELAGYPGLRPVLGASNVVKNLASYYQLYIVTARDIVVKETTLQWIECHFPGCFEDVIFVGNSYVSESPRSKEHVCQKLGISTIVDDSHSHAIACAALGIEAILFGNYPWQTIEFVAKELKVAHNWAQVKELLIS